MGNETLETRTLRQAKNVQLGDFMVPQGGGNATPDYVSDYNPWRGLENADNGIKAVGSMLGKQADLQAKEKEKRLESDFYNKVYNIQQMPTDIMSDSQKQIEINKLENEYKDVLKYETRNSIYSALGAGHKDSLIGMQQKAGREQLVEMEKNQNEKYRDFALRIDPAYQTLTPAQQIEMGKEKMDIVSAITAASSATFFTVDCNGAQCTEFRNKMFDAQALWSEDLNPTDMKVKYAMGEWTDEDTYNYINNMSRSLQSSVNPFTGTVLSKQQADAIAKEVGGRMFDNMEKEKLERSKRTVEYNKAYISLLRNNIIMNGKNETVKDAYIVSDGDIKMMADAYGATSLNDFLQKFGEDRKRLTALPNGHTNIPKDMRPQVKTVLSQNTSMPLMASDAFCSITNDQAEQPQSLATNQNMLEQLASRQDGWLNDLPSDYKKQNVDALKLAIPADIKTNIQSLVKVSLEPQKGEGWLQRAFRFLNNVTVGTGTTIAEDGAIRGANADAIESMLNEYTNELRRNGVDEKDIDDIISKGIESAGIKPEGKLVSDKITNTAFSIRMGLLSTVDAVDKVREPLDTVVERFVDNEQESEEPNEEQPKELTDDEIKKTPEYKELFRDIMSKARTGVMTDEQAKNELNVAVDNIRNNIQGNGDQVSYSASYTQASSFAPNIGSKALSVVNSIIGVKKANAMEAGMELTKQNELSPAMEKKYSSGDNYIVYKDHKGHKTIGGGVLLDAEARRYFGEKGYMNLGTGHQVPKSVVDEYMKKKYNEKNDLTERQLKNRGIDTKQLPSSLRCVCNDLGYIGKPVKGFFDKVAKYMKAKTEQEKRMCILDMKKHIDANIEGNKDRRDKLKTILDSL